MSIERVNYFDRQFLRVEDFADEQSYQIAMRRRHNISHHTWGIVEGLEPKFIDGGLYVSPGLAVDGFGRELIVETVQALSTRFFADLNTHEIQIWIDYSTADTMPSPKGFAPFKAEGEGPFYRVSEKAQIRLSKPAPASKPPLPESVLPSDREFDATRAAPEDRRWPVFLGTVIARPQNPGQPYVIDLSERPYAGLIGEGIIAPSGGARVQIGSDSAGGSDRFGVFVPADDESPRLAVQEDGTVNARGETTFQGSLTIGGSLEIAVGPATSPQPWRLYRVQETDAHGTTHNELRIEMAGEGGGNNEVVFGAWSQKDSKFKECLTIADDGTVTVSGNLVINGKLDVNPDSLVPGQVSAEAKAFMASGMLASLSLGQLQLHRAAQIRTQALAGMPPAQGPEQRLRELATMIAHPDQEHLHAFAAILKTDFKGVTEKLKQVLET